MSAFHSLLPTQLGQAAVMEPINRGCDVKTPRPECRSDHLRRRSAPIVEISERFNDSMPGPLFILLNTPLLTAQGPLSCLARLDCY